MLLGKRPRPPIRRTTSMTGITVDLPNIDNDAPEASDYQHHHPLNNNNNNNNQHLEEGSLNYNNNSSHMSSSSNYGLHESDQRFLAASTLSPRNVPTRRNSADYLETANFLRICGLCERHLAPGKDIYMYRGDTAFCSLACREKQMKHDERKEKYGIMGSKKEDHHASQSTTNSSTSKSSSSSSSSSSRKSETVAAA